MFPDFIKNIEQYLNSTINSGYSVGAHAITGRDSDFSDDKFIKNAESIMNNGLNVNASGNILNTCQFYGDSQDVNYRDIISHNFGYISLTENGNVYSIIIAIPQTFTDEFGNEFFLGSFPKNIEKKDRSNYENHPINQFIRKNDNMLPKEFIVGITGINSQNQKPFFFKYNKDFIGLKPNNQKIMLYKYIKSKITDPQVEMVTPEVIEKVNRIEKAYKSFNMELPLYEKQLRDYATEKYYGKKHNMQNH